MSAATRQLMLTVLTLLVVGGALAWWVYQQTVVPALTTSPPPSETVSPLAAPAINDLRARQLYGELPLKPIDASGRTDPFVTQ